MLAFGYAWKVRCGKCGHRGSITAGVAELAGHVLKCSGCGFKQPFTPEVVMPNRRIGMSSRRRRDIKASRPPRVAPAIALDDPIDDLFMAG